MIPSINDIERIVREVLAELAAAKPVASGQCSVASEPQFQNPKSEIPPSPIPHPPSATPQPLTFNDRVVTLEHVAGRLNGAKRIVVSREAVVTPAVRDELLRRGIALEFADAPKKQTEPLRLAIVVLGSSFDPASLVAGLTRDGFRVEHAISDCILASTEQLATEIAAPDTLGVLLTRHTAAGLCLANRLSGVRAITGADASTVATASAAVGANLLIADPKAGTFFQLKQMIAEFGRGGVRDCPPVFQAKLA